MRYRNRSNATQTLDDGRRIGPGEEFDSDDSGLDTEEARERWLDDAETDENAEDGAVPAEAEIPAPGGKDEATDKPADSGKAKPRP